MMVIQLLTKIITELHFYKQVGRNEGLNIAINLRMKN